MQFPEIAIIVELGIFLTITLPFHGWQARQHLLDNIPPTNIRLLVLYVLVYRRFGEYNVSRYAHCVVLSDLIRSLGRLSLWFLRR